MGFSAVDCKVSEWTTYSKCSGGKYHGKCGYGTQTRTRYIEKHAKNGGKECPKELKESRQCLIKKCIDCKVGEWECKPCSTYSGIKKCERKVLVQPYVSCKTILFFAHNSCFLFFLTCTVWKKMWYFAQD